MSFHFSLSFSIHPQSKFIPLRLSSTIASYTTCHTAYFNSVSEHQNTPLESKELVGKVHTFSNLFKHFCIVFPQNSY